MLAQAIGATLALALAVALNPFAVIAVVLILAGRDGRRNGLLFALAWLVGLAAAAAVVAVLLVGADDPDSTTSALADWSRVAAGAVLVVLGARTFLQRPRTGDDVSTPRWMSSLEGASAGRSLGLGLLLSAVNPKHLVLIASVVAAVTETGVHGAEKVVALAVFVVIGSSTVVGAVLAHRFGGARAAAGLESLRRFMVANSAVMIAAVLLLIGASVLGDGLDGLGR